MFIKDYEDNKNDVDLEDCGTLEDFNKKVIHHESIKGKWYFYMRSYMYVCKWMKRDFRDTPRCSSSKVAIKDEQEW